MRDSALELWLMLLFIAVLLCVLAWVDSTKCTEMWAGSGMRSEWKVFAGCRLRMPDGKWIPAKNYREVSE